MDAPELYLESNHLQRSAAAQLLPQLLSQLPDSCHHHRLLDIGCGSGDMLSQTLLPRVPRYSSALGLDVSERMVKYARATYATDRLRFRCADIESPSVVPEIGQTFHRVFSFFCLHWIQDQKLALTNIHDLLEPDGYAVIVLLANNNVYNMYQAVAGRPRWSYAMEDWQRFVSPYWRDSEPAQRFCHLAASAELEVCHIDTPWTEHKYPSTSALTKAIRAISPFCSRIPSEQRNKFMRECTEEVLRIAPPDGDDCVTSRYQLIAAVVKRPCGGNYTGD